MKIKKLDLFAPWEIFHAFLSSAVVFFFKINFLKISIRNMIRVSSSLDTDQARQKVGPDLGPNCLHKLSAEDTRR